MEAQKWRYSQTLPHRRGKNHIKMRILRVVVKSAMSFGSFSHSEWHELDFGKTQLTHSGLRSQPTSLSSAFLLSRVKKLLDWLELPMSMIIECMELRRSIAITKQMNISAAVFWTVGVILLDVALPPYIYTIAEIVGNYSKPNGEFNHPNGEGRDENGNCSCDVTIGCGGTGASEGTTAWCVNEICCGSGWDS
ncbi:hypothetical protein HN51_011245 [Arachis hypogaea]